MASIFTSQTPAVLDNSSSAITVGVLFQASVAGNVTGVRVYRGNSSLGSPSGALYSWTSNTAGSLLASKAFGTITTNGWTSVTFDSPVAITANTKYVAAAGPCTAFQSTYGGFSSAITNGDLTALADGGSSANGKYIETGSLAYPSSTYGSSNYWVDVVFEAVTFLPKQASMALHFF